MESIYNIHITPNGTNYYKTFEEMSSPIRVPINVGGELYTVTQQDCRQIIDIRNISLQKLNSLDFLEGIHSNNNRVKSTEENMQKSNNNLNMQDLCQCIDWLRNQGLVLTPAYNTVSPNLANVEFDPRQLRRNVAPIQTQIDWSKGSKEYRPNQFTLSVQTSTSELNYFPICADYNNRYDASSVLRTNKPTETRVEERSCDTNDLVRNVSRGIMTDVTVATSLRKGKSFLKLEQNVDSYC